MFVSFIRAECYESRLIQDSQNKGDFGDYSSFQVDGVGR